MDLPVIDLQVFLEAQRVDSVEVRSLCRIVADTLAFSGVLVVRDPRVSSADNAAFIDMMEEYFSQPHERKMADVRASLAYQVGATPELVEVPRCKADPECLRAVSEQPAEHRATVPEGPDPKWRFFWRVGPRPPPGATAFMELNAEPVVPDGFPHWGKTMDKWGRQMIDAVTTVAEMAALGFDLPQDTFTELMRDGPHLLAPTGSDLARYNNPGTVFAGFHYDLNFLTIHGKSRFPGLFIWLRDGRRVSVVVPDGCLLIQAGKQLEWLTGGHIKAGMHEVVYTHATADAAEAAQREGRSTWRVSSTLFAHIASDRILQPLGRFAEEKAASQYPATQAGAYVESELRVIKLQAAPS